MTVSIYSRYYGIDLVEEDHRVSIGLRPAVPRVDYPDSIVHIVVGYETLDGLARRYYGREDLWWRIADANSGTFPLDWKAGDRLIIPPIRVATRMPRR